MRWVALAVAVAATQLPVPSAGASGCAMETMTLYTFTVRAATDRNAYRLGDRVRISLEVTRPSDEDPAGAGVAVGSPAAQPAAGVNVGVGVRVGNHFLFGMAVTDDRGRASFPIRLRPAIGTGSATLDALAWNTAVNSPCLIVQEIGYSHTGRAFRVRG